MLHLTLFDMDPFRLKFFEEGVADSAVHSFYFRDGWDSAAIRGKVSYIWCPESGRLYKLDTKESFKPNHYKIIHLGKETLIPITPIR